jgi:hypothetical protein
MVLGAPLGVLLAAMLSPRAAFVLVAVLAAVTVLSLLQSGVGSDAPTRSTLRERLRPMRSRAVVVTLAVTCLVMTASNSMYTYLAVLLGTVAGPVGLGLFIGAFGVGGMVGTWWGGTAADRGGSRPTRRRGHDRQRTGLRIWTADGTWERILDEVIVKDDSTAPSSGPSASTPAASGPTSTPREPGKRGLHHRVGRSPRRRRRSPRTIPRRTDQQDLAVDGRGLPMSVIITPGQAGDNPQLLPLLNQVAVVRDGPGRPPRTRPERVLADKTSHALKLSSSLLGSGRGHRECGVFVVGLACGEAVVQTADEAVEQVALGGVVSVAGGSAPVVVGSGAG